MPLWGGRRQSCRYKIIFFCFVGFFGILALLGDTVSHFWGNLACSGGAVCCCLVLLLKAKSPSGKAGPHEQNFPFPPSEVPPTKYFSCRLLGDTVSHFWGKFWGDNQQPKAIFDFSFPCGVAPDRSVDTKYFSFLLLDFSTYLPFPGDSHFPYFQQLGRNQQPKS